MAGAKYGAVPARIHRLDTEPPVDEDDAYSAPTKVGPLPQVAVRELFANSERAFPHGMPILFENEDARPGSTAPFGSQTPRSGVRSIEPHLNGTGTVVMTNPFVHTAAPIGPPAPVGILAAPPTPRRGLNTRVLVALSVTIAFILAVVLPAVCILFLG